MIEALRTVHSHFISADHIYDGHNLGLRLDKLNPKINDDDDEYKYNYKDSILEIMSNFRMSSENYRSYHYAFFKWKEIIEKQENCLCFDISSITKVLSGTGNASVHEFGVNLNKPWGVPYISGTTLKGLVSSYLAENGGLDWGKNENSIKSINQVELFGGKIDDDANSYIGSIVFNDAWLYPEKDKSWFVIDIINVHNKKYYRGERLPDGTENPVPVKIAALKPDLKFFVSIQGEEKQLNFVKSILKKALIDNGIGGKTSIGYGRFEILQSNEEQYSETRERILNAEINELVDLYKQYKNQTILIKDFIQAIDSHPLNENLVLLYKRLNPLKEIRLNIESDKIKSFDDLKDIYKKLKDNIKNFRKNNPDVTIQKMPDAQKIFDYALRKFSLSTDEIANNSFLTMIGYNWEDIEINDDNILDIIDNLPDRVWPPVEGLYEVIEKLPLSDDVKELALSELN
ncbi:Putative CRISPR type III-B/RAMP module RAMP protein [Desulfonema limicola]|uniref:CRISPR type III-B/RAMP module RAMP protein n=1 Tax=Desulfonema limicola TaxID=45656 RepID=A0A975B7G4_9BACT|nr:type III-B CRISPR module RAMP protein Cmr6 [Desulfonema limicola]QTA80251.1 Putative CRISPR type III-B/RAMP module RAMP protein [Desulfonema limicola]